MPQVMWNLPRSGVEPMFPALQGRFLNHWTTGEVPVSPYISSSPPPSHVSPLPRPCPHPLGGMSLNRTCVSLCHRRCQGSAQNSGPELSFEPGRCGSPSWLCLLLVRDLGQVSQVSVDSHKMVQTTPSQRVEMKIEWANRWQVL